MDKRAEGNAARTAGLKEGDVLLALDGKPWNMTPPEFQMHVRLNHKPGDKLTFTVLRDGKTFPAVLTLVE